VELLAVVVLLAVVELPTAGENEERDSYAFSEKHFTEPTLSPVVSLHRRLHRRQLLRATPALLLGLAGCSAADGSSTFAAGNGDDREDSVEKSGIESDPPVQTARNPREREPVLVETVRDEERHFQDNIVSSRERAEEIEFAAGVSEDDATAVRQFLGETDFTTQSLYIVQRSVKSCYRIRIHSIAWSQQRVEYSYCRELRPPDVACEAEERDALALLIRIDESLDMDVRSAGASGHFPCENADTNYDRIEETAKPTNGTSTTDTSGSETTEDSR
jgi:hypothetical protein